MKIRNIFMIIYILFPILIFGTGGELFFRVLDYNGEWTWEFVNYSFNNGNPAKNPSIANYLNNIIITYQAEVNG